LSWSLTIARIDESDDLDEVLAAAQPSLADDSDEVAEQLAAAKAAIPALVEAVGGLPVGVTVHGHANPDHAPREGYSNDLVTVSVYSDRSAS
jgi:hypothetical protein